MTGRRRIGAAVGAVIVVGAAIAVPLLTSGSGSPKAGGHTSLTTATVRRTDLSQTTPVDGTVGFGGPHSVVQPGGTAASTVDQRRQAAAAAQQALSADRQAAADGGASDAQAVAQAQQAQTSAQAALQADTAALQRDQAALATDQAKEASDCQASGTDEGPSAQCTADQAQVAADQRSVDDDQQKVAADQAAVDAAAGQVRAAQLKAAQSANQAQAKVAGSELAASTAGSSLADAEDSQTSYDTTSRYTALPAVGQVVRPGQALWSIDGHAVVLLPGTLTPWRAFHRGMAAGPDVAELDRALIALGHGAGLVVSDDFTSATARAVQQLQAAVGAPRTGSLPLGSVSFEPAAVRVAAIHMAVGAPVTAGAPVLDVTSTAPIVDVALPVDQSYLVKVGDAVSVTLPDRTTSTGTITAVGTVATTATPAGGASSADASSPPAATIGVTVTLARTDGAAALDQAPVTVQITSATVHDVLAVPVTALVAVAGGGYAVEVVDGPTHRLVAVTTGLFDDRAGLVQVSGAGLAAGQKVVAPS